MITGGKILKLSGERKEEGGSNSFDVSIKVDNVEIEDKTIKIYYKYTVKYGEEFGTLGVEGVLYGEEEEIGPIKKEWEANKKLPKDYMEHVANVINHSGSAKSTVIATVLNTLPPIMLPRIRYKEE